MSPTIINLNDASLQNVENVTLLGTGAFSVVGNALNNVLTGNAAANTLSGGAGNDTLNGGAGVDTMAGGSGDDTYVVDNPAEFALIVENPGEGTDTIQSSVNATLVGLDNVENLTLIGAGNINGTGNAGNNTIIGNAGANVLDGGAGADAMSGGGGSDTYIVGAGDTVIEAIAGAPGGVDLVKSAVGFTLGDNLEKLMLTGTDNIDGTGNARNNVLTGNAGNNVLDGKVGADSMSGGLGDDTYKVDNAADVVTEAAGVGSGTDTVESSISYTLGANVENLTLAAGAGGINGTGNTLKNTLTGNEGNNILNGGAEVDTLIGGAGNDTLNGGTGIDSMQGGAGDDTYVLDNATELGLITENAAAGDDTLKIGYSVVSPTIINLNDASLQNVENVTLLGTGAFSVVGNALNNVLTGNAAANTLSGGAGNDILRGGGGNDTFIFDPADTTEVSGGAGNDILKLTGSGQSLDLAGKAGTLYTGLEAIDLTGGGTTPCP